MQKVSRARRSCLAAVLIAGSWVLSGGAARAQQATQAPQGWLFDLSGVGKEVGADTLADDGIYFNGRYLGQALDSVAGGRKQGTFYEGYTSFGVDLDMNRIAGINGGIVHFLISDVSGQSWDNYTSSYFGNDRAFSYGPGFRLNEFSWEQELFDNRVRILAGRVNLALDFDTSPIYCLFVTTICSSPTGFTFDKSATSYLTSAWGATTTLKPSKPTYVKFGVFEDQPDLADNNQNAWPGNNWDMQSSAGATIPVQIGYQTNAQNDPYPRAYDIGGYYDTASYTDPLLNRTGEARVLSGGTPLKDTGRSGVYLQAQQMVYRPDANSDRGLTLFAAANWTTSGETEIANDVVLGLSDKGMLAIRPNDILGIAATFVAIDHRVTQRIDDQIIAQGGTGHVSNQESMLEVNYAIGLAPGISLTPFVQYVAHPDQYANPNPSANMNYSVMAGAALAISFNQALGLPQLARGGY
jgi:porin